MNGKTMTLIGAILILVSLFMSAVTVSAGFLSKSINGYETDLIFTGLPGFVLLIIGLAGKATPGKRFSSGGAFFAILSLLVCGFVFLNISTIGTSQVDTAMGAAIPLCSLGSLLALVGSLNKTPGEMNLPITPTATPTNES